MNRFHTIIPIFKNVLIFTYNLRGNEFNVYTPFQVYFVSYKLESEHIPPDSSVWLILLKTYQINLTTRILVLELILITFEVLIYFPQNPSRSLPFPISVQERRFIFNGKANVFFPFWIILSKLSKFRWWQLSILCL